MTTKALSRMPGLTTSNGPPLLDGEVPSPLSEQRNTFAESQYSEESELELSWDTVAQENNIAVSDFAS